MLNIWTSFILLLTIKFKGVTKLYFTYYLCLAIIFSLWVYLSLWYLLYILSNYLSVFMCFLRFLFVCDRFWIRYHRGGSRAAATSKVLAVNYYPKALHLGCCSSPRSASRITSIQLLFMKEHLYSHCSCKCHLVIFNSFYFNLYL